MSSFVLANFFLSADYWDSVIRVSGPIALAALGANLASRAGMLYVGVEGILLVSAFFSISGTIWAGSVWLGVLVGAGAGVAMSLLLGVLTMTLRMGDVVGGLVVHIGSLGLTAFLLEQWFSTGATIGASKLDAPWGSFGGKAGEVLFHQQPLVYVALATVLLFELFLRTKWGLIVRSSGESVRAARSFGVNLLRLRFAVLGVSGFLTGLGGAVIGLAIVGTFDTNIVSGRGFIALACVMLGAWRPLGVVAAAALFGAAYALQFRVDVGEWIQVLPYVLTLVAIALLWGRAQGPAEEGRGVREEAN